MKNLPLVSIIVPAYNHAKYVGETIDSIMTQTYENIEFIIINDGSTDNTNEIILKYLEKYDNKFKYISKKNEGVCKTLNLGILKSKGKYISPIASDDIMLKNKIAEQVEAFGSFDKTVALVYSDSYKCTDAGSLTGKLSDTMNLKSENIFVDLLKGSVFIPPLTCMYKKEHLMKVGCFDEKLHFEDFDMFLKLSYNFNFKYIGKPLTISRDIPGSLGTKIQEKDMMYISNKYMDLLENNSEKLIIWKYRNRKIGFYLLDNFQINKGLKYIYKSLKTDKFNFKVYLKVVIKIIRFIVIILIGNNNFQKIRKKRNIIKIKQ